MKTATTTMKKLLLDTLLAVKTKGFILKCATNLSLLFVIIIFFFFSFFFSYSSNIAKIVPISLSLPANKAATSLSVC